MTKHLRFVCLFALLATLIGGLVVGLINVDPTSAQMEVPPGIPGSGLVLDLLASNLPYGGWLALDRSDDYAQADYQAELDLPPITGDYTVELWLKNPDFLGSSTWPWGPTPSPAFVRRLSLGLAFSSTRYGTIPPYNFRYDLYYSTGADIGNAALQKHAQPNSITASWIGIKIAECLNVSVACPPTGWYHLAYVYDHTADRVMIFWNGAVIRDVVGSTPPSTSTSPIVISGAEAIDDVRISSIVRYTAAFTVPTTPYVCDDNTRALWQFDEMESTTIFHDACGTADNLLVGYNGAHAEGVTGSLVYLPIIVR